MVDNGAESKGEGSNYLENSDSKALVDEVKAYTFKQSLNATLVLTTTTVIVLWNKPHT